MYILGFLEANTPRFLQDKVQTFSQVLLLCRRGQYVLTQTTIHR